MLFLDPLSLPMLLICVQIMLLGWGGVGENNGEWWVPDHSPYKHYLRGRSKNGVSLREDLFWYCVRAHDVVYFCGCWGLVLFWCSWVCLFIWNFAFQSLLNQESYNSPKTFLLTRKWERLSSCFNCVVLSSIGTKLIPITKQVVKFNL